MPDIHISVRNKICIAEKGAEIVCNNGDYNVVFDFEDDFANHNFKTARFIWNEEHADIVFDGNTCKIPVIENAEFVAVGVYTDNPLDTAPAIIKCRLSSTSENGKPHEPTQDVYNQIIALLNKYIEQACGGGFLDEERVREIVQEIAVTQENDPTVPDWAKKEEKPTYTAQEVGALPSDTPLFSGDYNDLTNKPTIPSIDGLAKENYVDNKAKETFESAKDYTDNELAVVNEILLQSGLVSEYKATIEDTYTERVTADGANVLDGSKAILQKVVGNTVVYDKDENGMNGKFANASFAGVESTNADGTKTSTLNFPKTEIPLGTTIDFENKKIIDASKVISFDGTEDWRISENVLGEARMWIPSKDLGILPVDSLAIVADIVCTDYEANSSDNLYIGKTGIALNTYGHIYILDKEFSKITDISVWKEYLSKKASAGNPLQIACYAVTATETPFTDEQSANLSFYVDKNGENKGAWYLAYNGGTEKVQGNDNAEYGAENTLSQNYIIVNKVD